MLRTSQTLYPIVPLSLFLGQFLFQRRGNVCWKLKRRTRLRYPLDLVRLVTICAIGQVIGNLSISHFVKCGGLLLGFSFFREETREMSFNGRTSSTSIALPCQSTYERQI